VSDPNSGKPKGPIVGGAAASPEPIPSGPPKPRAQISYEGDDEFSARSMDPNVRKRRQELKKKLASDEEPAAKIPDPQTERGGIWKLFRKIRGE
jgi:hypothetical protein